MMLHFSPFGPNSKAKGFLLSITAGLEWQEVFCEPQWRQADPSKGSGAVLIKTLLCPRGALSVARSWSYISNMQKVNVHAVK